MKGKESRVLGSGNRTRRDEDRRRKGKKSVGMADTKVCQRCAEILGIGQLLLPIY